MPAKVVIDERSGIIVMGRDVRVSTVAVAQGNLTVTISETPIVSQPEPLQRRLDRHRSAHRPSRSTSSRIANSPWCIRASPSRNWSTG